MENVIATCPRCGGWRGEHCHCDVGIKHIKVDPVRDSKAWDLTSKVKGTNGPPSTPGLSQEEYSQYLIAEIERLKKENTKLSKLISDHHAACGDSTPCEVISHLRNKTTELMDMIHDLKQSILVEVKGGVAYCKDPRVHIIDYDEDSQE